MTLDYEVLGRTIKHLRIKKGYSQEKLAEACDLSPSYISYIETGKKRLTLSLLMKIAAELNFTLKVCPLDSKFTPLGSVEANIINLISNCNIKEKLFLYNLLSYTVNQLEEFYLDQ
jgi:transcriptional regulator with XRE-family HTH domain